MANKIGLFYGSSTGNTETVSYQIKEEFNKYPEWEVEVHNIGATSPEQMMGYNFLIMGIPTWNTGQLQDDWEIFVPKFASMNLQGKKVALFGLGDQNGYGYNFQDALGDLTDEVLKRGADVMGLWAINGKYEFEESKAKVEDHFVGLAVDNDGQQGMTPARLSAWVQQVIEEFSGKFG
ncbi:MAG: flavodoxin FldA [Anaerolineae bacterium]